jgi:hypothetical protein
MAKHNDLWREREEDRAKEKRNREERKLLSMKVKKVFSTPDGKDVFNWLMERCHVFSTTMTGNSYTYYNEGARSVGLDILMMREQGWENEILLRRKEHKKTLTPKQDEED